MKIQLIFAGPALLSAMTKAFTHLQTAVHQRPDLTIYCWDSVSTRTPLSFLPWQNRKYSGKNEIPYKIENGLCMAYKRENELLNLINHKTKSGFFWTRDAASLPFYEKASPFRTLLQWCFQSAKRLCIHSAAVGVGDKGVLIAGGEKAGKSTSALFCLMAGMRYAGDDYVVLHEDRNYWSYSLYSTLKLEASAAKEMPGVLPKVSNIQKLPSEKAVLFLHEHYPEQLAQGFPVAAVLLPKITGSEKTRIQRAAAAEGLRALAPTTLFLQAGQRKEAFDFLTRFIRRTPCYRLDLGRDKTAVPSVIEEFIRNH